MIQKSDFCKTRECCNCLCLNAFEDGDEMSDLTEILICIGVCMFFFCDELERENKCSVKSRAKGYARKRERRCETIQID